MLGHTADPSVMDMIGSECLLNFSHQSGIDYISAPVSDKDWIDDFVICAVRYQSIIATYNIKSRVDGRGRRMAFIEKLLKSVKHAFMANST